MITVKNLKVLRGIEEHITHPKLIDLINWVCIRYSEVVFTESWRPMKHPNDLHGVEPVRARDIRSWIYSDPDAVEEDINNHFTYDPERLWMRCAIYHNSGQGPHLHLQVHDDTRYVK